MLVFNVTNPLTTTNMFGLDLNRKISKQAGNQPFSFMNLQITQFNLRPGNKKRHKMV